jgi:hypothetical protein
MTVTLRPSSFAARMTNPSRPRRVSSSDMPSAASAGDDAAVAMISAPSSLAESTKVGGRPVKPSSASVSSWRIAAIVGESPRRLTCRIALAASLAAT